MSNSAGANLTAQASRADFTVEKTDKISEKLAQLGKAANSTKSTDSSLFATGSQSRKTQPLTTDSRPRKTQPIAADVSLPTKAKRKPATVKGCYWVAEGKGWKLMRSKRDDRGNNPRIGTLSATAYKIIKSRCKNKDELTAALTSWAREKAREKGIEI